MRDVQGSAVEKLAMFERVRAAGGFANEHATDLEDSIDRSRLVAGGVFFDKPYDAVAVVQACKRSS
jgi:hypothetical protein